MLKRFFFLKILMQITVFQSIIFIRDYNSKGQEISGYIDYAHRLKTEDFEPYFSSRRKLLPKPSDLSFYNWESQLIISNNTPNYQVIAESVKGVLFKNKRDRKILNVDPSLVSLLLELLNSEIATWMLLKSLRQEITQQEMKL